MKKFYAFILDLVIAIPVIILVELILIIILARFISKDVLLIIERAMDFVLIAGYFVFTTKVFGTTLGRKILGIKEPYKFGIFTSKEIDDKFPDEHLKKNNALEVDIKNGYWDCPSCGTRSLEIYDVCKKCGQEVSKKRG